MNTAVTVADGIGGYPGPATLYRIDPPMQGTDHLIICHMKAVYGQAGQLAVLLATEDGATYRGDVRPQVGSYTTDEPNHHLALQLAGGYVLIESEATPALSPFNPADRTVAEVNDYLDHSDPAEQVRVLEAERNGKARKGILGEDVT